MKRETIAQKLKQIALCSLLVPLKLSAATFTVDRMDDPFPNGVCDDAIAMDCSLREAVINSNNNAGPDLIILAAGDYQLTRSGAGEDASVNGDLDVTEAVQIMGDTIDTTTVDGGGLAGINDRVFHFFNAGGSEISNLSIQGGLLTQSGFAFGGGGLFAQSSVNLTAVRFTQNQASVGGGAFYYFAGTTGDNQIVNCEFVDNMATASGGGFASLSGSVDIFDSRFSGNTAQITGGGMLLSGISSVSGSTIENNQALTGGGVSSTGELELDFVTINNNNALMSGGGIRKFQVNALTAFRNSTISNNTAQAAAAIELNVGTMTFVNTTISGNQGVDSVFELDNSTAAVFSHVSYVGNSSNSPITSATLITSGGIIYFGNSIVDKGCLGMSSLLSSAGGNVESPGNGCNFNAIGDQVNVPDLMLGPLRNNGGETLTHLPLVGSPAIDSSDNGICDSQTLDQRGQTRPIDFLGGGAICDAGSTEAPTTVDLSVTLIGNGYVSSQPNGISCGADCNQTFDYQDAVVLYAETPAFTEFDSWSGACSSSTGQFCQLTMDQGHNVFATFRVNTEIIFANSYEGN